MQDVLNLLVQAAQTAAALVQMVQQATSAASQYSNTAAQQGSGQQTGQNVGFQQSQPGFGQPGQYPQTQQAPFAGGGQTNTGNPGGQPQYQQQPQFGGQQQPQVQQFGGQPNTPQVTPDMIQQLITPLVQNEQIKQALTSQMQAMGIQNLPEAQPHQLPELYARFTQVRDHFASQGGGQQNVGQPQGGAPSII